MMSRNVQLALQFNENWPSATRARENTNETYTVFLGF